MAKEFGSFGAKGVEAVGDATIDRVGRIDPRGVALSRWNPGQKRDPLIDRVNRIYCKAALGRGGHNVQAQHQVAHIGGRDHDALLLMSPMPRQASKNPSIFSLTPRIVWIWPRWSTEPVTASACVIGASASAHNKAKSSAAEALSPSTLL